MKIGMIALCGIGAIASTASADFVGWTANVRSVSGGFLVNVFAVTDSSTDVILNVYGGTVGVPGAGSVTTTSAGGFKQGTGLQSVFSPSGNQSWTTLDSFLTVGGGFNTTSGDWTANSLTLGDPAWNVTYTDTTAGAVVVNSFSTQSSTPAFVNPNVASIPATGGWYVMGSTSSGQARSLESLSNRIASSSAAAASGTLGMMVAQLFVTDLTLTSGTFNFIEWNMGATLRRADGSTSSGMFQMTVPAPGAIALLAVGGMLASRRRR